MVKYKNLRDLVDFETPKILSVPKKNEFLLCLMCQTRFSAHKGDYWYLADEFVFTHCNNDMVLAREETKLVIMK